MAGAFLYAQSNPGFYYAHFMEGDGFLWQKDTSFEKLENIKYHVTKMETHVLSSVSL